MNILKVLTPERRIGNLGERVAARHLRRKGYRILERNYTAAGAEIDIIAKKKLVRAKSFCYTDIIKIIIKRSG